MAAKNTGYTGFDYGVVIGPDGESTDKISCFPSNVNRCIVVRKPRPAVSEGFVSPTSTTTTSFHDKDLVKATRKINAILDELVDSTDREERSLHILMTNEGPMLAWVDEHVIDDDGIR